jgi:hypothetical protein
MFSDQAHPQTLSSEPALVPAEKNKTGTANKHRRMVKNFLFTLFSRNKKHS